MNTYKQIITRYFEEETEYRSKLQQIQMDIASITESKSELITEINDRKLKIKEMKETMSRTKHNRLGCLRDIDEMEKMVNQKTNELKALEKEIKIESKKRTENEQKWTKLQQQMEQQMTSRESAIKENVVRAKGVQIGYNDDRKEFDEQYEIGAAAYLEEELSREMELQKKRKDEFKKKELKHLAAIKQIKDHQIETKEQIEKLENEMHFEKQKASQDVNLTQDQDHGASQSQSAAEEEVPPKMAVTKPKVKPNAKPAAKSKTKPTVKPNTKRKSSRITSRMKKKVAVKETESASESSSENEESEPSSANDGDDEEYVPEGVSSRKPKRKNKPTKMTKPTTTRQSMSSLRSRVRAKLNKNKSRTKNVEEVVMEQPEEEVLSQPKEKKTFSRRTSDEIESAAERKEKADDTERNEPRTSRRRSPRRQRKGGKTTRRTYGSVTRERRRNSSLQRKQKEMEEEDTEQENEGDGIDAEPMEVEEKKTRPMRRGRPKVKESVAGVKRRNTVMDSQVSSRTSSRRKKRKLGDNRTYSDLPPSNPKRIVRTKRKLGTKRKMMITADGEEILESAKSGDEIDIFNE